MKAIRGAITVDNNTEQDIYAKMQQLFSEIVKMNSITMDEVVSVVCTATIDLTAAYPGKAIRDLGFDVPILCVQEQNVEGSLAMCLRCMVYVDMERERRHVYLGQAKSLRPDLFER